MVHVPVLAPPHMPVSFLHPQSTLLQLQGAQAWRPGGVNTLKVRLTGGAQEACS